MVSLWEVAVSYERGTPVRIPDIRQVSILYLIFGWRREPDLGKDVELRFTGEHTIIYLRILVCLVIYDSW